MKPDSTPGDRGEPLSGMEPLLIEESSRHRATLNDLVFDLTRLSAGFRRSLPPAMQPPLASLVRAMNCYYSNLIEGHDTHPVDIERALKNDYSQDQKKRDLQLEAKAHISVQQWIDEGGLSGSRAVSVEGILETHRRFCEHLPEGLLWVQNPDTDERVRLVPGELRRRDVRVGQHIPVSPGALPRFLSRFEQVYGRLGKAEGLMAAAAAHHRLLWMNPFLDGNGRFARLLSNATLLSILDTGAVWSVARGLARNVQQYKSLLSNCDSSRRNDLDGRGTLSEEALVEFTRFFLTICIDQVRFMESLVQPDRLRVRVLVWANEGEIGLGTLPAQAVQFSKPFFIEASCPRGEIDAIAGSHRRQARTAHSVRAARSGHSLSRRRARVPRCIWHSRRELVQRWMPGLLSRTALSLPELRRADPTWPGAMTINGRRAPPMSGDDSTLTVGPLDSLTGQTGLPTVPALTIVWHPHLDRIGHIAPLTNLLEVDVAHVSRSEPIFLPPGADAGEATGTPVHQQGPDPRRRIQTRDLRKLHRVQEDQVEVDGQLLTTPRRVSAEDLRAGLIITLARRVVLCLHAVHFPISRSPALGLLGTSDAIEDVRRSIARLANKSTPVLLRGESGSGKEMAARALHQTGSRAKGPFVAVNMGRLDRNRAAADLFGHKKGSVRELRNPVARRRAAARATLRCRTFAVGPSGAGRAGAFRPLPG